MTEDSNIPEGEEPQGEEAQAPDSGADEAVDFGRWIAEGWRLIRDDLAGYFIATVILVVISVAAFKLFRFIGLALVGPLQAGFYLMVANHMRTGRPLIGDIFQAFSKFIPVFLASILIALGLAIGVVACFVGTIFGLGIWMFTFLFIVDQGLDFWDAMEASRNIAKQDYLEFCLFALVIVVMNCAGLLAFGIGVLVPLPLSVAAITCAYRELVGLAAEPAVKSVGPPPEMPSHPDPQA
jgi:uncharacterized membrane protein